MICAICNSSNLKFLASVSDVEYGTSNVLYDYHLCNACGAVCIEEPPLNKLDSIYPSNYYSNSSAAKYSGKVQQFMESVKKHLDGLLIKKCLSSIHKGSISCLDIGGGSGWVLDGVKHADSRVTECAVLDLNESSRAEVEAKGYKFIHSSIESEDSIGSYDFILLLNLLEHVSDPRKLLYRLYCILDYGGVVLIKTPNVRSLNFKLFNRLYWGGYHAPRHWVLLHKSLMDDLVLGLGFEILKFKYTQGGPQWAASILGAFDANGSKPMYKRFLFQLLCGLFALFDFVVVPFFKPDQMIYILKK